MSLKADLTTAYWLITSGHRKGSDAAVEEGLAKLWRIIEHRALDEKEDTDGS